MTSDPPGESLTRRTSASVIWMTAQKWVSRLGGLATIILLTRTLAPEDFGLAATASTLLPFVYLLADVGFSTYIVQASSVTSRTLSTAFWFSLLSGGALAALLAFVGAPVLGAVLDLPEVVPLVRVMTVSVLLIAVSSVPMSVMRRRMGFRTLAYIEVTGALAAQVVAVGAAFLGAGVWALILQFTVSQLVTAVWVWVVARWRPTREFSRGEFRVMGTFGVQVLGTGLVSVARTWGETAIIVGGLGVREMGYVNIAQRLVTAAQELSVSALIPVTTVAFSRVRDNVSRLRSSYVRASSISHAVVAPLMIFLAVSAPVLVPFLFGPGKSQSALVIPALAVVSLLNVAWALDEGLHLGVGRPGRWLVWLLGSGVVALAVLAVSVRWGLVALVSTMAVTAVLQAVARWFVVGRLIEERPWRVAVPLLGVVGPGLVAVLAGLAAMRLTAAAPSIVTLLATGCVVVATYLATLRLLRPLLLTDALSLLPSRLVRHLTWLAPRRRARGAGEATSDTTHEPARSSAP